MTIVDVDPIRIEEAGLNALQTQRQLFFDGWLLRVSPGKAKRARSVNPHFGSSLAVYRKFGFATAYAYHYRARPDECR
jgi:N-acetylglutamate synthase